MDGKGWGIIRILAESAKAGAALQREDGSFPGGHNGPWNERETPVRTTSNWARLMLFMHRMDGEGKHLECAKKALSFLAGGPCRDSGGPYRCREGKDPANGLIGQAWAIDALLDGYELLKDEGCLKAADEVLLLHRFDERRGLWHNARMDGTAAQVNNTLNQQVWFACAALRASRLGADRATGARAKAFFRKLRQNIRFDGRRIAHHMNPLTEILMPRQTDGYLSFLLFGLAKAHLEEPGSVDKDVISMVGPCIEYLGKTAFHKSPWPEYAWSYNPTGFEVAQAIEAFGLECGISAAEWAAEQVRRAYDFDKSMMSKDTDDPETLSSRICEACGLPDYPIRRTNGNKGDKKG